MNLQLWSELLSTIDALEKNKSVRGAIFTSGVERDVFTAGNDIKELVIEGRGHGRAEEL